MTINEVVQYYGSLYKACDAIKQTRQSGSMWRRKGYIPLKTQMLFKELTNSKLDLGKPYCREHVINE